jgi:hypothetical protein
MNRSFTGVAVLLVIVTALAMFLAALLFVPPAGWENFVPIATLIAVLCVVASVVIVEQIGEPPSRRMRQLMRR